MLVQCYAPNGLLYCMLAKKLKMSWNAKGLSGEVLDHNLMFSQ